MKPATKLDTLPIHRHFDCMKKCPMDCGKACKRLAYPKLVEALLALTESGHTPEDAAEYRRAAIRKADELLEELGELR